MAIKFVKCRRIDNPDLTADIAESALPHLSGWEPVPDEPEAEHGTTEAGARAGAPAPKPEQPQQANEPAPSPTRKSRSRAATNPEE